MYEPIKCSYILPDKHQPQDIFAELEYSNGDKVSANEVEGLVDIGKDRWPYKIPTSVNPITWKFINQTNDIHTYYQRVCINVAFRTIGWLINRKYRYIHDNTENTFFTQRFTHDLSVFNNREGVLAHAYLYHPSSPKNGVIEWNDNHYFTPFGDSLQAYLVDPVNYTEGERWTNGNLKTLVTQPFLEINMHEIKHAHGYWHDENSPESLMYPYVKRGTTVTWDNYGIPTNHVIEKSITWTEDDIARWHEGYSARPIYQRLLSIFRPRRVRGRFVTNIPYRVAV